MSSRVRSEIRLHGMGGQGIISAGRLIAEAASIHEHKEAIMTEDYSPYITGGWSRADIVVSDEAIDYPLVTKPEILVAMSQDALDQNWQLTPSNGTIITESSLVNTDEVKDRRIFVIPALNLAERLGKRVVANIIVLGFLTAKTGIIERSAMERAIALRYPKAVDLNRAAFSTGYEFKPTEAP